MKVLLLKNAPKLGNIGDVVDVKNGHARNYLFPQALATQPTETNLKAIEAQKQQYLQELAKVKAEIEARAAVVHGKEITIAARANEEGHLYGSIGPAQIVAALAAEQLFIEVENVLLDTPIHQLDKYDVPIKFAEDVRATIHLWVVPIRDDKGDGEHSDEAAGE